MFDPITPEDIYRAVHEVVGPVQLIGHWGNGFNREIKYNPVTKWFIVYDHGEAVDATALAARAARVYNEIKPRRD